MTLRIDQGKIAAHKLDHNGYLVVDALPTRAGIFEYRQPDGSVTRELRHPDEVFKADSLASMKLRPVTDNHPRMGRVDNTNTKFLSIGTCGESVSRTDDDYVSAKLQITDAAAIEKITDSDSPTVELSCGYTADILKEDGIYNGEKYDHVQKNIVYNHVALVERGRAGRKARIYLDSEDVAVSVELEREVREDSKPTHEVKKMPIKVKLPAVKTASFKLDAASLEIHEDSEAAFTAIEARLDSAIDQIAKLEGERDTLQAKVDALEEQVKLSPERLNEMATERADMIGVAEHMQMKDFASMSNKELKRAIVTKNGVKLDGKSDEYVDARYDMLCDQILEEHKGLESLANLRKVTSKNVTDADDLNRKREDGDKLSPRDQLNKELQDMHKQTAA